MDEAPKSKYPYECPAIVLAKLGSHAAVHLRCDRTISNADMEAAHARAGHQASMNVPRGKIVKKYSVDTIGGTVLAIYRWFD